ncbi:MAG: hypothetical protein LBS09_01755 [Bacteroidales bacterium]|jgi:hypothetical protein|nr:hypothetical protein [Bacteroidales bacterium]
MYRLLLISEPLDRLKHICTGFAVLFSVTLTAQDESGWLQDILTDIVVQSEEENNPEELLEQLEHLAEHPIYINQAGYEDLARLFWLTDFQIKSLLDYVQTKGAILSPYEIAYLYGFTPELAQNIAPFISMETPPEVWNPKPRNVFRYGKHKLITNAQSLFQRQEGYLRPDSAGVRYEGSPMKASLRYSFSYADRLHLGVTAEKDAGEAFFGGSNPHGFDFYSAHFQLNTKGWLKTLTLGDFRTDFGQGLILWSGMNYGKTAMLLNAARYRQQLRKYASMDENRFMRGAGVTLAWHPVEVTLFYSRKKIDATISEKDDSGEALAASSFPNTGYHRTATETAQKDAATEQAAGINISFTRTNWHIGATAAIYKYDVALTPTPYIYNHFAFSGKQGGNYSVDFRFRLGDALFYGEQAIVQNGASGGIYGSQMTIGERLTANVLYRRYARRFHAPFGAAFSENTQNSNEEGLYIGWTLDLGGQWRIASYADIFRFPWLRYRADAPSYGREIFLQTDYTPAQNTKMYIRLRYKEKEENTALPAIVSATVPAQTWTARYTLSHSITEHISIGNHVEIKRYGKDNTVSNGYFIAQDLRVSLQLAGQPLSVILRYALFDTDDYNSRIYAWENDMLYAFSIPAFYGRGNRLYLIARYTAGKHFDFRIKFDATRHADTESIGSGLNQIRGNLQSEWKAQIVCKF